MTTRGEALESDTGRCADDLLSDRGTCSRWPHGYMLSTALSRLPTPSPERSHGYSLLRGVHVHTPACLLQPTRLDMEAG
jgi:hypothetical protein